MRRTGQASRSLELHAVSIWLKFPTGFPRCKPVWSPLELAQTAIILHQGVLQLCYLPMHSLCPLSSSPGKCLALSYLYMKDVIRN